MLDCVTHACMRPSRTHPTVRMPRCRIQLPPPQKLQEWTSQSSRGVVCGTSVTPLHAEPPRSVQTHTTDLDLVDARSRGFTEQETTAVLPFHPTQRLTDAAAAHDGTMHTITQNPVQLMTIPAPSGSSGSGSGGGADAALPSLTATDLFDCFPQYHGDLRLKVASVETAFPGCAAVVEPDSGRILLVDTVRSTVQSFEFDGGSSGSGGGQASRSRGWGGFSRGAVDAEDSGYRVCKDLAPGGEVVLFDADTSKVRVVDMLANSVTTIALPTGGTIMNLMIPSRDSWVVSIEGGDGGGSADETLYSLTKASGGDLLPTVLTPITVKGATPVVSRVSPSTLSGVALEPAADGVHLISAPGGYAGTLGKLEAGGNVGSDGSYTVTGYLAGGGTNGSSGDAATVGSAHCNAVGCVVIASSVNAEDYRGDSEGGGRAAKPPAATLEVTTTNK